MSLVASEFIFDIGEYLIAGGNEVLFSGNLSRFFAKLTGVLGRPYKAPQTSTNDQLDIDNTDVFYENNPHSAERWQNLIPSL